jgi:putative acetyltransferase
MNSPPLIRPERAADAPGIRSVLEAAFAGTIEADLVDRLRVGGHFVLSLVAEQSGCIAGHVAFPRLTLATRGQTMPAVGLAPVGVLPSSQRQGIGSALIRAGLAHLMDAGEPIVFVLGEPDYYVRFGFRAVDGYVSPYAGPYFQALKLAPDAPASGVVTYPAPFADLD